MDKRRRNNLLWTLAIVLAAGPLPVAKPTSKPAPGRIKLTISKETTRILGPVNKDGTVNYVAYLEAKHSKGVTKTNNFAIPLIKMLGPYDAKDPTAREICSLLDIKYPLEGKDSFIPLWDYIKKTLSEKALDAWLESSDMHESLTRPWKTAEHPVMAKWLKVNEKTLDAMLLAVRRTRYFMPGVSPGQDVNVPTRRCLGLVACMGIRDGLVSRAMLKSASGDMQGAWTDLTAARLFARRLAQSCAPVECLIALEIEKTACQAIRAIACSGRLTEKQTRTFLTDMQRLEPIPDVVNLIDEQGRFLVLDFVMILARTFPKSGTKWIADIIEPLTPDITANLPAISPDVKTLEFDEMLLIINRWHDSFISAARRKTFKARKQALADHDRRIKKHISQTKEFMALNKKKATTRMMASRMIANALIARTLSPHHRMVMRRDETTAQSDTALVTMALAAYHADKKTYPAKLSQLKLEYLRSIPSDVFIDKPFGYKRKGKGYLLYSVGENMRLDDREDDYVKDDIAVEVQ